MLPLRRLSCHLSLLHKSCTRRNDLQENVIKLSDWSKQNGFSFSLIKITAIHFCQLRRCQHEMLVKINELPVPSADTVKYLGIIRDQKLTWKLYINQLKLTLLQKTKYN